MHTSRQWDRFNTSNIWNPWQWGLNEHGGVSNRRSLDCLVNRLFRHRPKKTSSSASLAFVRGIHRWPCWYPEEACPDSKVHGTSMGPIWSRQDPGGPHVGTMNLALWDSITLSNCQMNICTKNYTLLRLTRTYRTLNKSSPGRGTQNTWPSLLLSKST